eukprot:TRINITY_DN35442_c0_g1_i1.p1 TRINITY_DN35442_c0_g1~~TRINITY_DN35442_c0_g1_i1.p1  ORF type:complete len:262 (-),score=118.10 TRINITY_DN35442_c0_g1_i1:57-842(-)
MSNPPNNPSNDSSGRRSPISMSQVTPAAEGGHAEYSEEHDGALMRMLQKVNIARNLHVVRDPKTVHRRKRVDACITFVFLVVLIIYGVVTMQQELLGVSRVGVCKDGPEVTLSMLCDAWSMRQCSYHGELPGFASPKGFTSSPEDKEDGWTEADNSDTYSGYWSVNAVSTTLCTKYQGDKIQKQRFDHTGGVQMVLYKSCQPPNQNKKCLAPGQPVMALCCGQRERTTGESLLVWFGMVGGAAAALRVVLILFSYCIAGKN